MRNLILSHVKFKTESILKPDTRMECNECRQLFFSSTKFLDTRNCLYKEINIMLIGRALISEKSYNAIKQWKIQLSLTFFPSCSSLIYIFAYSVSFFYSLFTAAAVAAFCLMLTSKIISLSYIFCSLIFFHCLLLPIMLLYPQTSSGKKFLYRLYHGCYKGYCQGCGAFWRKVLIEVMRLNIKTNQGIGIKSMDESLMSIF